MYNYEEVENFISEKKRKQKVIKQFLDDIDADNKLFLSQLVAKDKIRKENSKKLEEELARLNEGAYI